MELGTQPVVMSVQHHNSVLSSSSSSSARPVMSPSRLARLPPISSGVGADQENKGEEEEGHHGHPSSLFLKTTTSELKETMQHLLSEVRTSLVKHNAVLTSM